MATPILDRSATLVPRAPKIDGVFRCDLCFQYCQGFAYHLGESQLMFDVRCGHKLGSANITHESHQQHLFLTGAKKGGRCKGCRNDCLDVSLGCAVCDFDLDLRCAGLPREARHRNDQNPLLLAYIGPNSDQYFCQVCEKKRDPKLWFYRCEECDFDSHIECVHREYHTRMSRSGTFALMTSTLIPWLWLKNLRTVLGTILNVTTMVSLVMSWPLNVLIPNAISSSTVEKAVANARE